MSKIGVCEQIWPVPCTINKVLFIHSTGHTQLFYKLPQRVFTGSLKLSKYCWDSDAERLRDQPTLYRMHFPTPWSKGNSKTKAPTVNIIFNLLLRTIYSVGLTVLSSPFCRKQMERPVCPAFKLVFGKGQIEWKLNPSESLEPENRNTMLCCWKERQWGPER